MGTNDKPAKQAFDISAGRDLTSFIKILDVISQDPQTRKVYEDVPDSVKQGRTLRQLVLDDLRDAMIFYYRDVPPDKRPNDYFAKLLRGRNPNEPINTSQARTIFDNEIEDFLDSVMGTKSRDLTPNSSAFSRSA